MDIQLSGKIPCPSHFLIANSLLIEFIAVRFSCSFTSTRSCMLLLLGVSKRPLILIGFLSMPVFFFFLIETDIENVFPGEYGIARSPLFFLGGDYWRQAFGLRQRPKDMDSEMSEVGGDIEPVSPDVQKRGGVVIRNLRKVFGGAFGKQVAAVDGLDLSMYEGQITAFLGHNGAGKTTTISILTGLIPPTSGDAYIFGYSIRNQMHLARRNLGVCPQHDVIWNALTVRDHLLLFAGLKVFPFPFFLGFLPFLFHSD